MLKIATLMALAAASPALGQAGSTTTTTTTQAPEPPPPPPAQPSSATSVTVNPTPPPPTAYPQPAPAYPQAPPVVVERERDPRSPLELVAVSAGYGALAGVLVGGGVALLEQGDHWERDLMVGTGAGILVGAAVGGVQAASRSGHDRVALDGLGTTVRDPPLAAARTVLRYAGRF